MARRSITISIVLWAMASTEYVQITDQNYALHFPEESSSDSRQTLGTDGRFQSMTFTEDYTMMSWVQIQETPSALWTSIWKIEHGGTESVNRVPAIYWFNSSGILFTVGTTANAVGNTYVSLAPSYPYWFHVSINVCGSTNYATGCLRFWDSTQSWSTFSLTGDVIKFDTNSKIIIGASIDNNSTSYPSPKMQVLDLRYYTGTCLTDAQIVAVFDDTKTCHTACSSYGCWGPGNYSCNQFITLIDPHKETILDAQSGVEDSSYKRWDGSDSFLMGRTYNSADIAFTGWVYQNNQASSWINLYRAQNVEINQWSIGWRIPGMFYKYDIGYRYQHSDTTGRLWPTTSTPNIADVTKNWNFVAGSTCGSLATPKFYSCYANITGGMQCITTTRSVTVENFDATGGTNPSLWVSDMWRNGPDSTFKDVRYYYNICLDNSTMSAIRNAFTCKQMCSSWSDPWHCAVCSDGFVLVSYQWVGCPYGWKTCNTDQTTCTSCIENYYSKSNSCVTVCGSDYFPQNSDMTCQTCHSCCSDWFGTADSQCSACNSGCYLQPYPLSNSCLSTCPTYYYTDAANICQACDASCASWSGTNANDWNSCFDHALLSEGVCSCKINYADSDAGNGMNCQSCHTVWNQCTVPDDSFAWIECASSYYLQSSGEWAETCPLGFCSDKASQTCYEWDETLVDCGEGSVCEWFDGYYFHLGVCLECLDSWATCIDGLGWLSCKENGSILDNKQWFPCGDYAGFGGTKSSVGVTVDPVWNAIWGDGLVLGRETCDDGNLDNYDGWNDKCILEDDVEAEMLFRTVSGDTYFFVLSFTQPVTIQEKITMTVQLSNDLTYSLDIEASDIKEFNAYQVNLTIVEDISSSIQVKFTIETEIYSLKGDVLTNLQFDMDLETKQKTEIEPTIPQTTTEAINNAAVTTVVATVVAQVAAGIASSSSSGGSGGGSFGITLNMTLVWGLVEICQMYAYMAYIAVIDSDRLTSAFGLMNFSNGDFLPNFFEFFIEEDDIEAPEIFAEDGSSTNFLLNAGPIVGAFLTNFLLLAVAFPVSKLAPNNASLKNAVDNMVLAAPFRIAIEGALEISLAVLLQLRNIDNLLGCIVCGVTIFGYFLLIFAIFTKVIFQPREVLEMEKWQQHYGGLYDGYRTDHWVYKSFLIWELFRKILYVTGLVVLTNQAQLQIMILILVQLVFLIACILIRPYSTRFQNSCKICNEVGFLFVLIIIAMMIQNENEIYTEVTAWVVIGLLAILVGGLAAYLLFVSAVNAFLSIIKLCEKIKKKCKRYRKVKNDSTIIEEDLSSSNKQPPVSPTSFRSQEKLVTNPSTPSSADPLKLQEYRLKYPKTNFPTTLEEYKAMHSKSNIPPKKPKRPNLPLNVVDETNPLPEPAINLAKLEEYRSRYPNTHFPATMEEYKAIHSNSNIPPNKSKRPKLPLYVFDG